MKKLCVLYIGGIENTGGGQSFSRNLFLYLKQRNNYHFLLLRTDNQFFDEFECPEVKFLDVPIVSKTAIFSLSLILFFQKHQIAKKYDEFLFDGPYLCLGMFKLKTVTFFTHGRIFKSFRHILENLSRNPRSSFHRLISEFFNRCFYIHNWQSLTVIHNSEFTYDQNRMLFSNLSAIVEEKISSWLLINPIFVEPPKKSIVDGQPTIIFFNNISEKKRVGLFVDFCLQLNQQIGGCRFLIMGKTVDEASKAQIEALPELITYVGHISSQNQIKTILTSAWLNISTSTVESFGYTIFESAAVGVPTIYLGDGGPKELLEKYNCGRCVESVEEAVKVVCSLITCRSQLEQLSKAACNMVKMKNLEFLENIT